MDETTKAAQRLIDEELYSLELDHPRPSKRILELRTHRNSYSHISRFPDEIFVQIFLLLSNSALTTAEWHQITHVCRHWRQVALDASLLWIRPTHCPLEYTELILERSRLASLDICFDQDLDTPPPVVDAVLKHSSRIKSLYIPQEDVIEHVLQTVNSSEHQFMRMETLRISCVNLMDENIPVPDAFFRYPLVVRILELDYACLEFNWTHLSLPNLTSLHLGRLQLTQPISGDTLLRTLKGIPKLQTLTLDITSILGGLATTQFSAVIHLLELKKCCLLRSAFTAPSLLSHIIMPQLHKLRIMDPWSSSTDPGRHLALSTAISSALLNGAFGSCHSVFIGGDEVFISQQYPTNIESTNLGLLLIHGPIPPHVLVSAIQPLLSRLHKLEVCIHEATFDLDLSPADLVLLFEELPALKHLRIKTESSLESFATALNAYSEDCIPTLQHLTTVTLDNISIDARGDTPFFRFCNALAKRYNTGRGIELLRLDRCTALPNHIRYKLEEIHVRVKVDNSYVPKQLA